jgi:methionine biosynthesis protein MetW
MSENNLIRYDLKLIADLIRPNSRVLDIGCGDGELLEFLVQTKNVDGRGLEISQMQVSKSLLHGLNVVHRNAESDLAIYPDRSFDYAILSQTIQMMHQPKEVLSEMLRIAEFAIVSFSNFAHLQNRLHLLLKGEMPINKIHPFAWYETPNIHFCSIRDFEKLCDKSKFRIEKNIFMTMNHRLSGLLGGSFFANILAKNAIFLVSKKELLTNQQEEFAFNKPLKNLGLRPSTGAAYSKKVR